MVILGGNTAVAMGAGENLPNVIKVDEQDHYHEDWIPPFQFRHGVCIKTNEKFSDYYELHEEIGEGKFGKVYRCIERSTGLVLAAKCIRLKKDADLQKVEKEVNIMTQMRHKCIAQIYDAFATSTNNDVILIMEIVQGGELFDRVVDESYVLTEMAVAMIVHQICEAIRYIHSQNIIHLDLKPENIMCVSQTGNQIKLIDFGLAQYFDGQSDLFFMAGTPEFAAPEVIKYEPLDFHTDMWSVGVITYILLSGQSPFLGENIAHTYCNVERGKWEFCDEFRENCITSEAQNFISRLLVIDKDQRMLPDECLSHPWITLFRERSRNANWPAERQLDIGKLRSYVRNKRFRRLVFGVLFINTIVRMMNTLQDRRSEHGIRYVKDMLGAAQSNTTPEIRAPTSSSSMENVQSGNITVIKSTKVKSTTVEISSNESHIDVPKNANTTLVPTDQLFDSLVSISKNKSDGDSSLQSQQRHVFKSKRVKSDSRKASSTEQAPEKRTKTSTPNAEQRSSTSSSPNVGSNKIEHLAEVSKKSAESLMEPMFSNSRSSVVSKLKNMDMFEEKASAELQMSVAAVTESSVAIVKNIQADDAKKFKNSPIKMQGALKAFAKKMAPKTEENKIDTRQRILSAKKVKKNGDLNDGSTAVITLLYTSKARSASPLLVSQKAFKESAKNTLAENPEKNIKNPDDSRNKVKLIKFKNDSGSDSISRLKESKKKPDSGGSKVNSLLRKLESNKNENGGKITMAVTEYLPPKLSAIRRHGSVKNLNTTVVDLFRQSYKAHGQHKIIAIPPQIDDEKTSTSSKKLALKMEHKVTHQHKAAVKTNIYKSTTLRGDLSLAAEKCNEVLVDDTTSELMSVRQNLRSVVKMPQNHGDMAVSPAKSDPSCLSSGTFELNDNRLTKITSDQTTQKPNGKDDKIIDKNTKTEVSYKRSENEFVDKRAVRCIDSAIIHTEKIICKASKMDVVESIDVETEQGVLSRAHNSVGDETSQPSKRNKKITMKIKTPTVKRLPDTKTESRKPTISLNELSNSGKFDPKSVTYLNEALLTETHDWHMKRANVSDNLKISVKNNNEHPNSEGDLSKKTKKNEKHLSLKIRSTHRPSDEFSFEYDAFDFSALRLKLQQRIMNAVNDAGGSNGNSYTQPTSNQLKCELRVQLPDAGVVMKTRNKWLDMDKATSKNVA